MLTKAILCGIALASTPFVVIGSTQDPKDSPAAREFAPAGPELRDDTAPAVATDGKDAQIERLEAELAQLRERVAQAQAQVQALGGQVDEAMDLLVDSTNERRHHCSPSRRLLTYHKFMQKNGHGERAEKIVDRLVKEHNNDNNALNAFAWNLMTEKNTVGQFDGLALSIAERMQKNRHLDHQQLDTVALAKFLNGKVEEAIALQRRAIEQEGDSHDYRRRLRTYETALAMAGNQRPATASVAVSDEEDD